MKSILIFGLLLFACTPESKVKKAAEEGVRQKMESIYKQESAPLLASHKILQSIYVNTLLEKTEVNIDNVEISGDAAKVTVSVKSIAGPVRAAVREIILRLDPAKQDGFNVPNALGLVAGQLRSQEPVVTEKSVVHLKNDGGWKMNSP